MGFDSADGGHTMLDIPFAAEPSQCMLILVGETKRYAFETRTDALGFALKLAEERSKHGGSVSINIEGADHIWRTFDPSMKPRT